METSMHGVLNRGRRGVGLFRVCVMILVRMVAIAFLPQHKHNNWIAVTGNAVTNVVMP